LAGRGWWSAATVLLAGVALPAIRQVRTGTTGKDLNPVLGMTGKLLLIYAVVFSLTWPLGS
jgi:1,4-dihydroxy-2-naphthoate octaprenyltransferase